MEREFGHIDFLVNCAGVTDDELFVKTSADNMQAHFIYSFLALLSSSHITAASRCHQPLGCDVPQQSRSPANAEASLRYLYSDNWLVGSLLKNRLPSGRIVNVGSVIGLMGNTGQAVYSASKAGLVGTSLRNHAMLIAALMLWLAMQV